MSYLSRNDIEKISNRVIAQYKETYIPERRMCYRVDVTELAAMLGYRIVYAYIIASRCCYQVILLLRDVSVPGASPFKFMEVNPIANYIPFTEEQREQARQTDLVAFLRQCGEIVKPSGSEFQWNNDGQKITIRGNVWYNQYEQFGGDAISFAQHFYDYSYQDAVCLMLAMNCGIAVPSYTSYPAAPFQLPEKHDNMRRVYAYLLRQRGIDKEVLDSFTYRGLIYESAKYHNVVFVGKDKDGNPRHAHKRGSGSQSTYKGNAPGSLPGYSFHWVGASDRLYLFEAPVDLLSYISMHKSGWRNHSYAASCSVSDKVLWQMLNDYPYIKRVFLCFDSDNAGKEAAKRIAEKLKQQHIECEILVPVGKDWNEDLTI